MVFGLLCVRLSVLPTVEKIRLDTKYRDHISNLLSCQIAQLVTVNCLHKLAAKSTRIRPMSLKIIHFLTGSLEGSVANLEQPLRENLERTINVQLDTQQEARNWFQPIQGMQC